MATRGTPAGLPAPGALPPLRPGETVGRYLLVEPLGAGGMGVVYQAWDTELDRRVALKLIRIDALESEASLPRFLREARLAARLRHPHIVGVHDVGEAGGRHYIAMDFVDGTTLEERLSSERLATIATGDAAIGRIRANVELLAQAAEAVGCAHAQGVVHRDLKPANVLIDEEGRARVSDFGLAKETVGDGGVQRSNLLTAAGQAMGTPAYMSPEQATADLPALGPHSDVWSLGVILYEVLTGSLPFDDEDVMQVLVRIVNEDPVAPRARNPEIPADLEKVCLKALEKGEGRRYPNAGAMAEDLRRWLQGEPVRARGVNATQRAARWAGRRKSVLIPAALAVLLLTAALGWADRERRRTREQVFRLLGDVAGAVQRFEDQVRRTEMPAEARAALAAQPLGVLARLMDLAPSFGPAYSWRGRVRQMLGSQEEADRDFDQAVALSPDSSLVWILRGMSRIERYALLRSLPSVGMGPTGMKFDPPRPETPAERHLRESGLHDLAEADRRAGADETIRPEELAIGRGLAALHGGAGDGPTRALACLEGIDRLDAAFARGMALYLLLRFEAAAEVLDRVVAEWPMHLDALYTRGMSRQAIGLALQARGRDGAIEQFAASIEDFTLMLRRECAVPAVVHNARAASWTHRSKSESECGLDPVPSLRAAIADYAEAVRTLPGYAAAILNAAVTYRRLAEALGDRGEDPGPSYRSAIAMASRLLEANPNDASARNTRGMAWLSLASRQAHAGEDARDGFRRALDDLSAGLASIPEDTLLRGNRGLAWKGLGSAQAARGEDPTPSLQRAIEDLTVALDREPNHFNAWLNRAGAWSELGDWTGSRGNDARAPYRRAITDFAEAIRVNPHSAAAFSNRGNTWGSLAQYEEESGRDARELRQNAIDDHTEAMRLNPGYRVAQHNRAEAYRALAEHEMRRGRPAQEALRRAEADASEVIRQNPAFTAAWISRGMSRMRAAQVRELLGEDARDAYREAIGDLGESLTRGSVHPLARTSRAAAWQALGRAEETRGGNPGEMYRNALVDLNAVIAEYPRHAPVLTSRASIHEDLARTDRQQGRDGLPHLRRALADRESAMALQPALPRARGERAALHLMTGDAEWNLGLDPRPVWSLGVADATAAIERDPETAAWWNVRGSCRLGLADVEWALGGRPDELWSAAEADLRCAAERGDSSALENLATVLRLLGRDEDAIRMLRETGKRVPSRRDLVEAKTEEIRSGVPGVREPWTAAWRESSSWLTAGRSDLALAGFARAFAAFARFQAGVKADDRARRRLHPERSAETAAAHYNHACALLRAFPLDPAQRDRALLELECARDWGWRDARLSRQDPDLAPLRGEPRFEGWLRRLDR